MLAVDLGLWKLKGSGLVALKWFCFFCSSIVCWNVFYSLLKSGTGFALGGMNVNSEFDSMGSFTPLVTISCFFFSSYSCILGGSFD